MTSVGKVLRTEREAQGREVPEIAEELCITKRYLRAIEEDDLKSLPGSFFYKSFVKQYAALLGVDEQRIMPAVEALTAGAEPLPLPGGDPRYAVRAREESNTDAFAGLMSDDRPSIRALDPIVEDANRRRFSDRRIGLSLAVLVAVLLGCSGFYAWWNKAPQPFAVRTPQQAGMAAAFPNTAATAAAPSSAPSNTAEPTVSVTTTTGSDGVNHLVLNLSATEETWLSITSDGKQIFSGVLQPSQTKTLTTPEVAKMRVGNAGGLEVRWNGKSIGPIGPRGQVRVIVFTPENFQIFGPSQTL
jgi:cytoskeleton protein RodZ